MGLLRADERITPAVAAGRSARRKDRIWPARLCPVSSGRSVVFVFAHPDDESHWGSGVALRCHDEGARTVLVTATPADGAALAASASVLRPSDPVFLYSSVGPTSALSRGGSCWRRPPSAASGGGPPGMMMYHTHQRCLVPKTKVAVTVDADLLDRVDELVAARRFANRSQAVESALAETVARLARTRLARECAKVDRHEEQALAEEGFAGSRDTWPEY